MKEPLESITFSYLISRSFRYKRQFRIFISQMRSAGLLDHLTQTHLNIELSEKEKDIEITPVEIGHVMIIFYGYIFFAIIAYSILGIEVLWHSMRK